MQTDANGLRDNASLSAKIWRTDVSEGLIFGGLEVEAQAVVAVRLQRRSDVLCF